eukprot:scaffold473952_cov46-Prasinocladus_malaysianus.AAC.1
MEPKTEPKTAKAKERKPKKGKFVAMDEVKNHTERSAPQENGAPIPTGKSPQTIEPELVLASSAKKAKKSQSSQPTATPKQEPITEAKPAQEDEKQSDACASPPPEAIKKSVKFSMRSNLYFPFGGPVPDADVRTPPTARPKGPALKKTSAFGATQTPHRFKKKSGKPRTPRSAPRASAADFF